MKRLVGIGIWLLLALICGRKAVFAQSIPEAPQHPTILSCGSYNAGLAEFISGIYKRTTQCFRSEGPGSRSSWDRRPSCVPGPPAHIRQSITPYPNCAGEEEILCAAYEAQQLAVPDCLARARASANPNDRQFSALSRLIRTQQEYDTIKDRLQDPSKLFRAWVLPRLPSHISAKLDLYDTSLQAALPPGFKVGAPGKSLLTFSPF